jgi:hypothetical protein
MIMIRHTALKAVEAAREGVLLVNVIDLIINFYSFWPGHPVVGDERRN